MLHQIGIILKYQTFKESASHRFVKKAEENINTILKKILKTIIFRYKPRLITLFKKIKPLIKPLNGVI